MQGRTKAPALRLPAARRLRNAALIIGALLLTVGPVFAMTVDDVIRLLDGGVGESVILDQIQAASARFDLSTQDILDLKQAGASDSLIQDMIQTASENPVGSQGATTPSGTDWRSPYYLYPGTQMSLYYDPFAYQWNAWPFYFSYYYPFEWGDLGFYYAGWWNHRWWRYGSWVDHYWTRYHWSHMPPGAVGGQHGWGRRAAGGGWGRQVGAGRSRYLTAPGRGTGYGVRNDPRALSPGVHSYGGTGRGAWGRGPARNYGSSGSWPSGAPAPSASPSPPAGSGNQHHDAPSAPANRGDSGRHAYGR